MEFIKLTDDGLVIAPRSEIYDQLALYAKAAYGDDLMLTSGSAFDIFLQMLADGLATVNGSVQSFSELYSTKELSGAFLDFVAGRRGIIRRRKSNQTVTMVVNVASSVTRPFVASAGSIVVTENTTGTVRSWVNTTQLLIQPFKFEATGNYSSVENLQGTCEFGLVPLDGYDTELLPALTQMTVDYSKTIGLKDGDVTSVVSVSLSNPPIAETETDAEFRARYDQAVYANAVSTVEGLRSQLLKHTNYVRIHENISPITDDYGIPGHSIWVIVGGTSTAANAPTVSEDGTDIQIANTILNYKSLGCGVATSNKVTSAAAGTGNFVCDIPMGSMIAQIPFTRLVPNAVSFAATGSGSTRSGGIQLSASALYADQAALQSTVCALVKESVTNFLNGLQPGEVVTSADLMNAIQDVLAKYPVGAFDCKIIPIPQYAIGTGIDIYQKAVAGDTIDVYFKL